MNQAHLIFYFQVGEHSFFHFDDFDLFFIFLIKFTLLVSNILKLIKTKISYMTLVPFLGNLHFSTVSEMYDVLL